MVVTARATIRQTHENGAGSVGDVVQNLLTPLLEIARIALIGIVAMEAGGDARFRIVGPQFVTGDLLLYEAVVRLVFVERADHVVAVAPRVRTWLVRFEALAFRETGQIKPVTAPALPVSRRCEQAVHYGLKRLRRMIGQ